MIPPESTSSRLHPSTEAALEAFKRGYQPIPILDKQKRPAIAHWTKVSWTDPVEVENRFEEWAAEGHTNIGLLTGSASGNLVDVDLDHPKTMRLKDMLLPPTRMITGRAGNRRSHWWYVCEPDTLPPTMQHKMPDGQMCVELRADRTQTVIPPSLHPAGYESYHERYLWEGEPWGGPEGPDRIDGRVLAVQVTLLALATTLVDCWPDKGSRHSAYLALAGGLLRWGENDVHPWWGRGNNAAFLIENIADATRDEEGAELRVKESVGSTLTKLRQGEKVTGFTRLGEMIGEDYLRKVRSLVSELEQLAGFRQERPKVTIPESVDDDEEQPPVEPLLERDEHDPLSWRETSWSRVDIDDYITGRIKRPQPSLFFRSDGKPLMYAFKVNMMFGSSESAKTWMALVLCHQEIEQGHRVAYLDFEDDPDETVGRMRDLGVGIDDLRTQFAYFHPEGPFAEMERDRWGRNTSSEVGRRNSAAFNAELDKFQPQLIIIDGLTILYGLHGLDPNDNKDTTVIAAWVKSLARKHTVVIIDHTTKSTSRGSYPYGANTKVQMNQGNLIQVWPTIQPIRGRIGELELISVKDRPGGVRPYSGSEIKNAARSAQVSAIVRMDSTREGRVDVQVLPFDQRSQPDPNEDPEADLRDSQAAQRMSRKISEEHLIRRSFDEVGQGLTAGQLVERSGFTEQRVRVIAERLVGLGELSRESIQTGKRGRPAIQYVLALQDLEAVDSDDEET